MAQHWNAYHNMYWPALYLIDKAGQIRYVHIGEGAYNEIETNIQGFIGQSILREEEVLMSDIYKSVPVLSSEITPKSLYFNRRGFLKPRAHDGGAVLAACAPQEASPLPIPPALRLMRAKRMNWAIR